MSFGVLIVFSLEEKEWLERGEEVRDCGIREVRWRRGDLYRGFRSIVKWGLRIDD